MKHLHIILALTVSLVVVAIAVWVIASVVYAEPHVPYDPGCKVNRTEIPCEL